MPRNYTMLRTLVLWALLILFALQHIGKLNSLLFQWSTENIKGFDAAGLFLNHF
jgi:hypothetical protein